MIGRINIPDSNFYLPFYLDTGGGSVPFTWQVYAGVAYKATTWLDASVGYRYLTFDGGGKTAGVEKLNLGGVILGATSASRPHVCGQTAGSSLRYMMSEGCVG
jgi:hypothetical protein